MEADKILRVVEDAFQHHYFIIDFIISDDDSTL